MPSSNPTTGLGVAAKIAIGATNTSSPWKEVLSISGTSPNPASYQIEAQVQDVSGAEVAGAALTLTQVATSNGAALTLTAVAASSGGVAVYTGTITGGGTNALVGYEFTVTGFAGANNNGTYLVTASTTTTLTLANTGATAETHAGTATQVGNQAIYTGTITGGGSNAFQGFTVTVTGFVNAVNNGTFTVTNSSTTTLVLSNAAATNETHAGTATIESAAALTYLVAEGSLGVIQVSPSGLVTPLKVGESSVEISYPFASNTLGNTPNGWPLEKIYYTLNFRVNL